MRYTIEMLFQKPRAEVFALLTDPERRQHWQPGLAGRDVSEGDGKTAGTKATVRFAMEGHEMAMDESITEYIEGEKVSFTFSGPGVINHQSNRVEDGDEAGTTRYFNDNEFLFEGMTEAEMEAMDVEAFKAQTMVYMEAFRAYLEEGKSVLES